MHEAASGGSFANGKVDPSEAGRRGAQVREERWHDRLGRHREELEKLAVPAIESLGKVVKEEASPKIVPAATAILDRIGLGPNRKQEVEVTGSERLKAMIERLDAMD